MQRTLILVFMALIMTMKLPAQKSDLFIYPAETIEREMALLNEIENAVMERSYAEKTPINWKPFFTTLFIGTVVSVITGCYVFQPVGACTGLLVTGCIVVVNPARYDKRERLMAGLGAATGCGLGAIVSYGVILLGYSYYY